MHSHSLTVCNQAQHQQKGKDGHEQQQCVSAVNAIPPLTSCFDPRILINPKPPGHAPCTGQGLAGKGMQAGRGAGACPRTQTFLSASLPPRL
eukprot:1161755-Pelagomonas_calceolata.AAC.6